MPLKALDYESLNEKVKKVQYAVRGELYLRASELQKEGKKVQSLSGLIVPMTILSNFRAVSLFQFLVCRLFSQMLGILML